MFRRKMKKSNSRRQFKRSARGAHRKNFQDNPKRGGIRL